MELKFTKMQGCGNDYIYINCFETHVDAPEKLAAILADRHYGIGGDGIVLIMPSTIADAKMRMFNSDGSEGKMCGNAIRCVAKYLYAKGIVTKETMAIETLSGTKELRLNIINGEVVSVQVDMGKPILRPDMIPVNLPGEQVVGRSVTIGGKDYKITCVSMGNPHCVVFCDEIETLDLTEIGPLFENHPLFPDRVNTEFVKMLSKNHLQMRVWERGSGETLACGTGACASVVAAVLCGITEKDVEVKVSLRGGDLFVCYTDQGVLMTGDCHKVFDGMIHLAGTTIDESW